MPKTERFYYFTPTKYAIEGLRNCRLKAAELDKANDPFEFLPVQCKDETEETLFQNVKQSVSDDLKMVCFSKTFQNPSLWGHYADNCRGISLGFDIEVHEKEEHRNIIKMEYLKDKKDPAYFGFHYVDGALQRDTTVPHRIHRYKSHHWENEEEWRVWEVEKQLELDPATGLYFFRFGDLLKLREILVGFRCEEVNIQRRFEAALRDNGKYPAPKPKIISTRLSSSAFEIEKVT